MPESRNPVLVDKLGNEIAFEQAAGKLCRDIAHELVGWRCSFDDAVDLPTGSPRFHNLIERSCRPSPENVRRVRHCRQCRSVHIDGEEADQCGVRPA